MASFADAVNALVAERDRQFVLRVATDYNLDVDELQKKYLETAEMAIKVPRKYKKRDATSVTVVTEPKAPKAPKEPKAKAEKQKCTACTSKKEPCKFSAMKGEVFCKRHLKQTVSEPAEPKAPKPAKAPKKAAQPVHTHDLTDGVVKDCDLCQSHGNPLVEAVGFELAAAPHTGPIKPVSIESLLFGTPSGDDEEPTTTPASVESRLAALLAGADEPVESDAESEAESDEEEAAAPYSCPEESDGDGTLSEEEFEEED